ncbi:hypothetical protein [Rhizobium sp. CECT 9324]|uniref:hypothetical protein n=1 Tax=Rhizobium sp. CECT 9324 TaxID=2845820 RepID=UPI001E2DDCC9|nr:hypothetical protein [Rhizobium sp. CECT 9324]CAH0343178.1 hypothetical protein RHI9324_04911 [Rhizobium sp. CECT 9324]
MPFNSNGVDQRTVDLKVRPNAPMPDDTWSLAGRTLRNISEISGRVCNMILVGQSADHNSVQGTTTPANPTKIFNLSLSHPMSRQNFQAKEPLLTSDLTNGHHGISLADELLTAGHLDNFVLTQVAIGCCYAADCAPGGGDVGGFYAGSSSGALAYRIGLAASPSIMPGSGALPQSLIGSRESGTAMDQLAPVMPLTMRRWKKLLPNFGLLGCFGRETACSFIVVRG